MPEKRKKPCDQCHTCSRAVTGGLNEKTAEHTSHSDVDSASA